MLKGWDFYSGSQFFFLFRDLFVCSISKRTALDPNSFALTFIGD